MFYIYILRNNNNKLYIGQSNNPLDRLKRHQYGDAALFTSRNQGFSIVYQEAFETLLQARRREKQLKGWTRSKKEALIAGDLVRLKQL